jgi:alanine-synthesizing transaminase
VLLIHPHNPTGAFVDPADLAALRALARERRLTIVSDEVFADAAYGHGAPPSVLAGADEGPLHVVLSGASKPLALPQLKVAWLAVAGPPALRDDALARLEFIADAYLSVSPLLARTLPRLFAARPAIAAELRARVAGNRAHLAAAARAHPRIELLAAEAGWAAILRVRGLDDEEAFVLDLFERTGVLVHPGFVFDLDPGHLVVSLLPEPEVFARGTGTVVNG